MEPGEDFRGSKLRRTAFDLSLDVGTRGAGMEFDGFASFWIRNDGPTGGNGTRVGSSSIVCPRNASLTSGNVGRQHLMMEFCGIQPFKRVK